MFRLVAIAGTFDRLHKGHEFFLRKTFEAGERVLIGLTSDKMASRKISSRLNRGQITDFNTRKKELEVFLKKNNFLQRTEIEEINDVYGSALERNDIQALVVTSNTLAGAREVNRKRKEHDMPPLSVVQVRMEKAEDGLVISSTRIRKGEIDRWGKVFKKLPVFGTRIHEELRRELKLPIGILVHGDRNDLELVLPELRLIISRVKPVMICSVGDEVTRLCNRSGIPLDIAAVDFRVERHEKYHSFEDVGFTSVRKIKSIYNPPGHLMRNLVRSVEKAIRYSESGNTAVIHVIGEEDLAALPIILLAPLGSLVVYGQPGEGVVAVEVTEEVKHKLVSLIESYI